MPSFDINTWQGSWVALVTPMHADGSLAEAYLRDLVDWHCKQGTDGLVILGTTAESPTLTESERVAIIRLCIEQCGGRIPIMVGTGTNNSVTSCALSAQAVKMGADALLVVTPYYNRPMPAGLVRHFSAVREASGDVPMILYNVPKRTGCDIDLATLRHLADTGIIQGLKDATGDISRVADYAEALPSTFRLWSGDDESCVDFMQQGGHGVITVAGNLVPHDMHALSQAALSSDNAEVDMLQERLQPLFKLLGVEVNPIPIKWALYLAQRIPEGIRLPLTPLSEALRDSFSSHIRPFL